MRHDPRPTLYDLVNIDIPIFSIFFSFLTLLQNQFPQQGRLLDLGALDEGELALTLLGQTLLELSEPEGE